MSTRFGWHGRLAFAGAVAASLAVAAPAGAATTVRVDGGQTTLDVADRTADRFLALDVKIGMNPPARTRRSDSVIPITGGTIDPATARGTLRHGGSITILRGAEEIRLRALQIRVAGRSFLSARVGARRVDVLSLAIRRGSVSRAGFGTVVRPVAARVTRAGVAAINRALGVDALRNGQTFGRVGFRVDPAQIALTGGDTTLTFNATTQGALAQLRVAVAPIAPATAGATGLVFPVTGGTLDVETLAGTIEQQGGISLSGAGTTVELTQPTVTFSDTPQLGVSYAGAPIAIGDLMVVGEPEVDARERTISASISGVRLTSTAALALGGFFRTDVFRAGLDIATATLTAEAR